MPQQPVRMRRALSLVSAGLLGATLCAPGLAQSISITSGTTHTSILGGQQTHYLFINGRYVIHTPLPALGINLNPYRSSSSYLLPWDATINGVPAWFYGYPPYYGPSYLAPRSSFGRYGVHPFDYSARPWYWPKFYQGPPLLEIARRIDPALVDMPAPRTGGSSFYNPAPPPAPPLAPPTDDALDALARRNYEHAANLFQDRANQREDAERKDPGTLETDRTALRLRAVALAGAGRMPEAARAFLQAYDADPKLAKEPLLGFALMQSARELREIVNGAVKYAHIADTSEAWRMVAYLMQAEGRETLAQQMLARAGVAATPHPGAAPPTTTTPAGKIPGGVIPDPDPPAPDPDTGDDDPS